MAVEVADGFRILFLKPFHVSNFLLLIYQTKLSSKWQLFFYEEGFFGLIIEFLQEHQMAIVCYQDLS